MPKIITLQVLDEPQHEKLFKIRFRCPICREQAPPLYATQGGITYFKDIAAQHACTMCCTKCSQVLTLDFNPTGEG